MVEERCALVGAEVGLPLAVDGLRRLPRFGRPPPTCERATTRTTAPHQRATLRLNSEMDLGPLVDALPWQSCGPQLGDWRLFRHVRGSQGRGLVAALDRTATCRHLLGRLHCQGAPL